MDVDLAAGGVGVVGWDGGGDARDPDLFAIGFGGFVDEGAGGEGAVVGAQEAFIAEVDDGFLEGLGCGFFWWAPFGGFCSYTVRG